MKPPLLLLPSNLSLPTTSLSLSPNFTLAKPNYPNSKFFLKLPTIHPHFSFKPYFVNRHQNFTFCSLHSSIELNDANPVTDTQPVEPSDSINQLHFVEIRNPNVPPFVSAWASKFSLTDRGFFLFTFIVCTTTAALVSYVAAAVPTLYAMGRAANSLAKLADTAREELPSTMAAIRLSGMEISDLTLELSDLSQEISEGVNKSAQAVQAAEVGVRQIGALARNKTASMIEERASLPVISVQPVVSGAAKKTSRAVGHATRTFLNMISGGKGKSENEEDDSVDRLDI